MDFTAGAMVRFDGVLRTATFVTSGQVTLALSAADVAVARTVNVAVVNPDGGVTAPATFTVQ